MGKIKPTCWGEFGLASSAIQVICKTQNQNY